MTIFQHSFNLSDNFIFQLQLWILLGKWPYRYFSKQLIHGHWFFQLVISTFYQSVIKDVSKFSFLKTPILWGKKTNCEIWTIQIACIDLLKQSFIALQTSCTFVQECFRVVISEDAFSIKKPRHFRIVFGCSPRNTIMAFSSNKKTMHELGKCLMKHSSEQW